MLINSLSLDSLRKQVGAQPNSTESLQKLISALLTLNRDTEAELYIQKFIALTPNQGWGYEMLATCCQRLGRFDEATTNYRKAIEAEPERGVSYYGLVAFKTITEEDRPLILKMANILDRSTNPQTRKLMCFGLGKALDDLGDYERSMRYIDEAHRISVNSPNQGERPFNHKAYQEATDSYIHSITGDFILRNQSVGLESELPILIIGMPRSGTTLVEQILTSHPDIGGGGELDFWRTNVGSLFRNGSFQRDVAAHTALEYRRLLRSLSPRKLRVTDKQPVNYMCLGVIHLLFPNARIIHCRRHPLDTSLSIYLTPYSVAPEYAHKRQDIVFAYRQYERVMHHWRTVVPANRILEVDYEDIVADRETQTRNMIEFAGLRWDDACLRYEKNDRIVQTPSKWQVRQPIYSSSVGRWRRYLPWLGEFAELLTPEEAAPSDPCPEQTHI